MQTYATCDLTHQKEWGKKHGCRVSSSPFVFISQIVFFCFAARRFSAPVLHKLWFSSDSAAAAVWCHCHNFLAVSPRKEKIRSRLLSAGKTTLWQFLFQVTCQSHFLSSHRLTFHPHPSCKYLPSDLYVQAEPSGGFSLAAQRVQPRQFGLSCSCCVLRRSVNWVVTGEQNDSSLNRHRHFSDTVQKVMLKAHCLRHVHCWKKRQRICVSYKTTINVRVKVNNWQSCRGKLLIGIGADFLHCRLSTCNFKSNFRLPCDTFLL